MTTNGGPQKRQVLPEWILRAVVALMVPALGWLMYWGRSVDQQLVLERQHRTEAIDGYRRLATVESSSRDLAAEQRAIHQLIINSVQQPLRDLANEIGGLRNDFAVFRETVGELRGEVRSLRSTSHPP